MLGFIQNNIGTIIVAAAVLVILAFAAWRMISDKKQGKSSCGGSCGCCPNSALCHAARDGEAKNS